MYTSQVSLEP